MHDHIVSGKIILPATAMIEIFVAAGGALSLLGAVEGQMERCPAVALAAIHRAVILRRKGRFDTLIEVTVFDGSMVLQEAGGSLVAEATSTMARREERTTRKLPMKERLYQQFVVAAGRALGSFRQYISDKFSQEEHVPISFLDGGGVSDDGCLLVPELADAATHIQAAGQSQGRSTLYLPSTIDFCTVFSMEGDSIRDNGLELPRKEDVGGVCAIGRVSLSERLLQSTICLTSRAIISGLSSKLVDQAGPTID